MSFTSGRLTASAALAVLVVLLAADSAAAEGSVAPSFGNGRLTLVGEGYRAGERVEITVSVGGATHQFTATADGRGSFRLETGLAVQPGSSVKIEARDEQGMTQATITSGPGNLPLGTSNLPPAPAGAAPTAGGAPARVAPPSAVPSQLPRTGTASLVPMTVLATGAILLAGGLGVRRKIAARSRRTGPRL